jgi:hypothetical protein
VKKLIGGRLRWFYSICRSAEAAAAAAAIAAGEGGGGEGAGKGEGEGGSVGCGSGRRSINSTAARYCCCINIGGGSRNIDSICSFVNGHLLLPYLDIASSYYYYFPYCCCTISNKQLGETEAPGGQQPNPP